MGGFRKARVKLVCVGLAIGPCLWATTGTAAAKGSKPLISHFKAAPASVASEGITDVTAKVSRAKKCTLSANKAVAGLPATFSCKAGSVHRNVTMPANTGKKAAKYKLQLTAVASGGGKTQAKATVTVSPGGPRTGTGTAVAAGDSHTCALLSTGHVECWGINTVGQLGNGTTTQSDTPVEVSGITDATQLTTGADHTCALLSTGHVECWGNNELGELGNGTTTRSDTPVEVSGITDATQVTAGFVHTCALLSTGHVECWGGNTAAQLGDGSTTGPETCRVTAGPAPCATKPVATTGITDATQVTAGLGQTCALRSTGHVECWGEAAEGGGSDTPVEVSGITDATQVTAGVLDTCALRSTGHVECWGNDVGSGISYSGTPVDVSGITHATQVTTAAGSYTCAVLSTGHVECWGNNGFGELGDGTTSRRSNTPVDVSGITHATQVTAGGIHACAVLSTGHVECWGENRYGQLGNGTRTQYSDTPVKVKGI
jgi:alpha-tubulin suppressor-like RCC1 family protein